MNDDDLQLYTKVLGVPWSRTIPFATIESISRTVYQAVTPDSLDDVISSYCCAINRRGWQRTTRLAHDLPQSTQEWLADELDRALQRWRQANASQYQPRIEIEPPRFTIQRGADGATTVDVKAHLLPALSGMLLVLTLFFLVHSFFNDFTGYRNISFSHAHASDSRPGGHFVAKPIGFEHTPYFATMLIASLIQIASRLVFESQKLTISVHPDDGCVCIVREVLWKFRIRSQIPFSDLLGVAVQKRRTVLEYNGKTRTLRHAELVPAAGRRPIRFGQGLSQPELGRVVRALRQSLSACGVECNAAPRSRARQFEHALLTIGISPILIALSVVAGNFLLAGIQSVGSVEGPAPPIPPIENADFVLAGQWWGEIEDFRTGWSTAELTLHNAIPGEVSGDVRYSLGCRTKLRFSEVEVATYLYAQQYLGLACMGSRPTISLIHQPDGSIAFSSYNEDGERQARGSFARR